MISFRKQAATTTIQAKLKLVDDDNFHPLHSMRHSVSVTIYEAEGTAQLLVGFLSVVVVIVRGEVRAGEDPIIRCASM